MSARFVVWRLLLALFAVLRCMECDWIPEKSGIALHWSSLWSSFWLQPLHVDIFVDKHHKGIVWKEHAENLLHTLIYICYIKLFNKNNKIFSIKH